ncbi:MAG: acyltransferase family protein [Symploca sp. SIO2E9]|nr:acyltransferase family protein [Symploca sp. SIO2E9]
MGQENQQESSETIVRDERLDLVKAISISLILVWHLKPITILSVPTPYAFIQITNSILSQLFVNSILIAVPLFILTSLFLLFQKLQASGYQSFLKRCRRLLEIFIFWSFFQILIYYSISLLGSRTLNTLFSWYVPNFEVRRLFIEDEEFTFPIKLVGFPVLYFLSILILLIILSYIFYIFIDKQNIKFKNYVCVGIIILFAAYFEILNLTARGLSHWQLTNFLIYIPIAYLLVQKGIRINSRYSLLLYICFLVFGIQDIFLMQIGYIGTYSRVSIICGTLAIFNSCLNLEYWKASESVKFLSRFSLGIFAIHRYWQFIVYLAVSNLSQAMGFLREISDLNISIVIMFNIFVAVVTTLFTFGTVQLLNRSPFKRFIK